MRLTSQEEEHMTRILERFPMTVTKYYLSLIDWDNPEQDLCSGCPYLCS